MDTLVTNKNLIVIDTESKIINKKSKYKIYILKGNTEKNKLENITPINIIFYYNLGLVKISNLGSSRSICVNNKIVDLHRSIICDEFEDYSSNENTLTSSIVASFMNGRDYENAEKVIYIEEPLGAKYIFINEISVCGETEDTVIVARVNNHILINNGEIMATYPELRVANDMVAMFGWGEDNTNIDVVADIDIEYYNKIKNGSIV